MLAATPVSPVPRRVPGRGAWGHDPLTGAQVRYLVLTPTRVVAFSLDRDVGGPALYRLTQIEAECGRSAVRGVEVGRARPARRFTVLIDGGASWDLEVSATGHRMWGPVADVLGRRTPEAEKQAVVSPDAPA